LACVTVDPVPHTWVKVSHSLEEPAPQVHGTTAPAAIAVAEVTCELKTVRPAVVNGFIEAGKDR